MNLRNLLRSLTYSCCRDEDISHKDYEYVVKIWYGFIMSSMRDYHYFY